METKEYFKKVMQDYNLNRNGRSLRKYCQMEGIDYKWSMEVSIVFVNTFLKLILWNQIHQLREDGFSDRHNESKLDKYYIQQNEIFIEKFTNRHNKLNINKLGVY